nr:hypothetical protein [Tanacetum cinerariifolium]
MSTSVGNNSVFKSFFEKQKLTGPNFIDWYRQLCLVLSTKDKENYLEHPIPAAPVAPPGQQVPPAALAAHAAWELKAMYSKQVEQELLQTVREFHTCKQAEGQSLHEETLPKKDANPALHAIRAGRVQKNQKNKSRKAGKGSHGKVSKNNLVYFKAIPRDGIYEIDMSCSNTNDSSMYAITNKRAKIDLDSSLLWHCRLGHISKKRIEKLQHDGLLNSIDIESLGNYVMS